MLKPRNTEEPQQTYCLGTTRNRFREGVSGDKQTSEVFDNYLSNWTAGEDIPVNLEYARSKGKYIYSIILLLLFMTCIILFQNLSCASEVISYGRPKTGIKKPA